VTSVEVLAVRRALARRGGALSPRRRALPIVSEGEEQTCPLLDRDGRCSVYAARPLGCRTFWCHRAEHDDGPARQAELNELVRRVRAIAAAHRPHGDRGRPLIRALADLL